MSLETSRIVAAIDALEPAMTRTLAGLVAAPSISGAEEPAAAYLEGVLTALGLDTERIPLDSGAIRHLPLFACPCGPDNGRHNLLARHLPSAGGGRSILFNGHLDTVPTGPADLWSRSPFDPWVEDGWLHGRGAGDMKGGLVCPLIALQALHALGVQPAGIVGFNAVVNEEDTGNGTLATLHALTNAMARAKLTDFDAVIIPEPFDEMLFDAQVGACWVFVTITGKPAHVTYMTRGVNPIDAGMAVVADLKQLEAEWNAPENRPVRFRDADHPINFNLGRIDAGEWNSSVPCTCTLGLRFGFYPELSLAAARALVEARVKTVVQRLDSGLGVTFHYEGQAAPGCDFDLDTPAMRQLADAHRQVTGQAPARLASGATTDGRHFRMMTDLPVTVYGPVARDIHGVDEAVSLASMKRVAAALARFMVDWCGVEPYPAGNAQPPGKH